MLIPGSHFPPFSLQAVKGGPDGLREADGFQTYTERSDPGFWKIIVFWPLDFTPVCESEVVGFDRIQPECVARNTVIYGVSADSHYVHQSWRKHEPALNDLNIPLLSDLKRELASACGILDPQLGVPLRATFILDPQGIIQSSNINSVFIGRGSQETLRTLDALQTGKYCLYDWQRNPLIQPAPQ